MTPVISQFPVIKKGNIRMSEVPRISPTDFETLKRELIASDLDFRVETARISDHNEPVRFLVREELSSTGQYYVCAIIEDRDASGTGNDSQEGRTPNQPDLNSDRVRSEIPSITYSEGDEDLTGLRLNNDSLNQWDIVKVLDVVLSISVIIASAALFTMASPVVAFIALGFGVSMLLYSIFGRTLDRGSVWTKPGVVVQSVLVGASCALLPTLPLKAALIATAAATTLSLLLVNDRADKLEDVFEPMDRVKHKAKHAIVQPMIRGLVIVAVVLATLYLVTNALERRSAKRNVNENYRKTLNGVVQDTSTSGSTSDGSSQLNERRGIVSSRSDSRVLRYYRR